MRADVSRDFQWGRTFIPEIKRICANYLITEAPEEEDQQRNTDLLVLKAETKRIACRIRKHQYLDRYGDQFTIRAGRPSGVPTELRKLISGWGDYILYGFADQSETQLAAWFLGDLNVFRLWHQMETWRGNKPGIKQNNGDGSSWFMAYRLDDLPQEFVVSRVAASREAA